MSKIKPGVSIGMPVFNGEPYIVEALNSLLAQTYTDFELIISDNASTDRTEEICRRYAREDKRIRYYRNKKNLGAAKNYNRVFELSNSKYFKWAAHDDVLAPEYLQRCIEILDHDPAVVLCHPKTIVIDEYGKKVNDYDDYLDFRSPNPHERFRDYLFRNFGKCNAIFGVIRTNELRKTPLIGSYSPSDEVLMAELALYGKIYQIPDRLFYRREHPERSKRANPNPRAHAIWFNPENKNKIILPTKWKSFWEYIRAITRIPLGCSDKVLCYLYIAKWRSDNLIFTPLIKKIKSANKYLIA